jgi:nicotinamide-nucleotide amidase|tara:strand:- start:8588 stop:9058 length:471 start_codon:yes stop_codon:yes gene_type:complete
MNFKCKKIVKILRKKKLKIALAESCTGGILSSKITAVIGSSKVFTMGLVTYSNESKNSILKVPKNIIKKYGAVSSECCSSMVRNLRKISKSKVCVSITGIAGPGGGSRKKPVGLVFIGFQKEKKITIKKYLYKNKGRLFIQNSAINSSLDLILKNI